MKKIAILSLLLLSCASIAPEAKPVSKCIDPPDKYEGIQLTMCQMSGQYNVCGYGFLPDGPQGQICFLTLMQSKGCQDEWRFVDASCFENPFKKKGTLTRHNHDPRENLHRTARG